VRQKRERDQELLVWPDLVFIEFIAATVFTLAFVALSAACSHMQSE
jgi:menaquinol-cytochrome c reductase cytochrome b/c subunit